MISLSHWYGRLGNNIQQCAVGTLWAEQTDSSFESIDHETVSYTHLTLPTNREV